MNKLQDGHIKSGRWILVPVSDLTTPKAGRICYGPRWWKVTNDNMALFFDHYTSPQCNINKAIIERPSKAYDAPETRPQFIEMSFIPHECHDYV